MARLSDHDVRDAEAYLRLETSGMLGLFRRRIEERGKAYIMEAIESAVESGEEQIDGRQIGRDAFRFAAYQYFKSMIDGGLPTALDGEQEEEEEKAEEPAPKKRRRKLLGS